MRSSPAVDVLSHFDRLSASGDWTRLYAVADGATYHFHVRRARVLDLLPERLGRVLDVGCGPGVMVAAVLARGGRFDGLDLSPEMVREAHARFGSQPDVQVRQGKVEAIDAPDATFDQVLCMGVLEYQATPDRALSEIARVLRPGGIAIVTVPKRWHVDRLTLPLTWPVRGLVRLFGHGSDDGLRRLCLQPEELSGAAEKVGLVPDGGASFCFTPFPYPFTRLAPALAMRLNAPFERFHGTRNHLLRFLAHGWIGRFRKPV